MEEIKEDIYQTEKRLKSLMASSYQVTTNGVNNYSVPSDFGEDLSITLMDGAHYGVAQYGTDFSIALATKENIGMDIIGKLIFVYDGAAINQAGQCFSYSPLTKVAGISPGWVTLPDPGDLYLIIDRYIDLVSVPVWDFERVGYQTETNAPTHFSPIGDTGWGEFLLYPTPYRATGVPWGLKYRYFANLLTLDLASPMLATLYYKWRNVWIQGVFSKALEDMDDNRAPAEMTKYRGMINQMVSREKYGNQIADMQIRVGDYE
jgi:hypothetical protein